MLMTVSVILHKKDYDVWLRTPTDDAPTLAAPFSSQLVTVAGF